MLHPQFNKDGNVPPYACVWGDEVAREHRGTYGDHGPDTEQFAIGSIMLRLNLRIQQQLLTFCGTGCFLPQIIATLRLS